MFTVTHKKHPEWTYVVYGVHKTDHGTRFLLWDGKWRWENADNFEPVDDNG